MLRLSASCLEVECGQEGHVSSDRDPVTGLSTKDREAIRISWAIVSKETQANGTALMLRFFKEYPGNLNYFKDFRDLTPTELQDSPGLQQHAMRVMTALTAVVDNIDSPHALIGILHKTVDSHFARGIRKAQFSELFDVFARFLQASVGEHFTSDMAIAWQTAAATILAVVEERMKEQSRGAASSQ